MAKHRSPKNESQASVGKSLTVEVALPVLGALSETREAFHELCIRTGQQVLRAMMEADREALCGPKGRHQAGRQCWRGGSTASRVTLGGRQVELPRLRVRSPEGEVALASFQWAASSDAMDAHTLAAVAAGVSTRDYPKLLDPMPETMNERGTSRSALSRPIRGVVAQADGRVPVASSGRARHRGGVHRCEILPRALRADSVGRGFSGHQARSGASRGLDGECPGGARSARRPGRAGAAHRALGAVRHRRGEGVAPGHRGCLRRTGRHSALPGVRNVLSLASTSTRRLGAACARPSTAPRRRAVSGVCGSFPRARPSRRRCLGARGARRDPDRRAPGADRCLAAHRALDQRHREPGSVERYTRNVKRWRGGEMIQRWVSAALLEAEGRFRRVRGFRDMSRLMIVLDNPSGHFKSSEGRVENSGARHLQTEVPAEFGLNSRVSN